MSKEAVLLPQAQAMSQLMSFHKLLDDAAKEQGMFYNTMSVDSARKGTLSTGVLSLDLALGGGHPPGRMTYFYGPTGTCKSTTLYLSLEEILHKGIHCVFLDAEASTDPAYLKKLGIDISKVEGVRNKKGEWVVPPQLFYFQPNTVENCFRYLHAVLKKTPDKIMLMDGDTPRYFIVDPSFPYKPLWTYVNKGLKEGKIFEVEDGCPQAVFFIDSLRALTPIALDDDSEKESIAMFARSLSAGFNLVKGLLGKKTCNLIATNHLTINPMARFGSPEAEPGGQAVQFYPDVKIKLHVNRAQSKIIVEPSVSGGTDRYLQGYATVLKNKAGSSFRQADYRIWIDSDGEPGRGMCPVFDVRNFLEKTNQLVGDEKKFTITVPGFEYSFTPTEFKKFVLEHEDYPKLRETLKEQLKSGEAQTKYYEYLTQASKPAKKGKKEAAAAAAAEEDSTEDADLAALGGEEVLEI